MINAAIAAALGLLVSAQEPQPIDDYPTAITCLAHLTVGGEEVDPVEEDRRTALAIDLAGRRAARDGVPWTQREADVEAAIDAVWDGIFAEDEADYVAGRQAYHVCFARLGLPYPD